MSDTDEPAAAAASSSKDLVVNNATFDLDALFGFKALQDLLRQLAKQQDAQLELIQGLRADLGSANSNGDDVAKKLKAEIDLKASEKALTELALETSRDKTAMQKQHEQFSNETEKKFAKHEQKLETQQSKLYDCKVALDTKAETRTVDALTTRVDGCATAVELADAKIALRSKIDDVEAATGARHSKAEANLEMHGNRISDLERLSLTLATKEEMKDLEKRCVDADKAQADETRAVEERGKHALGEATRVLEARHAKAEETMERHWSHIRNVEELVRTKADREMVQQGIDKAAADTAAVDAKFSQITSEHIQRTDEWQAVADRRLDSAEVRLDEAEASLKTKATLEETRELREKVALCSLRTEMRELLEGLRQETSSRVRILKERLDRTDRELLRQLEDSQNNDRSDKFDALAAMVESKADKALTERWLEASQQLHGELQVGGRPQARSPKPVAPGSRHRAERRVLTHRRPLSSRALRVCAADGARAHTDPRAGHEGGPWLGGGHGRQGDWPPGGAAPHGPAGAVVARGAAVCPQRHGARDDLKSQGHALDADNGGGWRSASARFARGIWRREALVAPDDWRPEPRRQRARRAQAAADRR